MKIKGIEIENGLQHAKLKAEFSDFNVIIGPNGCGKSSILELIGFALTGKFTWPGPIETLVRQGEEKGSVNLSLESDGDLIDLSVALGRTSKKLTRGDLKIGKAGEVMEYLEQAVLRTPFEVVNEASIIRQGMLTEGLFTTQAKRQHAFQRLAGLIDIESKRKILSDAKLLVAPHMITFNIEEHQRQVDELTEKQTKLNKELNDLLAEKMDEDEYKSFKKLLESVETYNKHNSEYQNLKVERDELRPVLEETEEAFKACQAKAKALAAEFKLVSDRYPAAVEILAKFESVEKQIKSREKLLARLEEATAFLDALVEVPSTFEHQKELDDLRDLRSSAESGVEQANKVINSLSAEDKKCPVCSTNLDNPDSIIQENTKTKTELQQVIKEADAAITEYRKQKSEWETALKTYRDDLSSLTTHVANVQQSLEELGDIEDINIDESTKIEAQTTVSDHARLTKEIDDAGANVSDAESLYRTAKDAMAEIATKIRSVVKFLKDLGAGGGDITEEHLRNCEVLVSKFESHRESVSELKGRISEVDSALEAAKASLEKVQHQAGVAQKYSEYADHIEFARSVLHRDSYPSGKIQNFIDRALANADAYLEAMNAGFNVSYDHEDGFRAYFPSNGRMIRADRLSGGEKIVFALAFRFAVNEVKSETGILMLDEPTVHLDEEHVDRMVDVLGLVKKKLAGRVQMFIVTHNDRMCSVADTVIEVPKVAS